MIKITELSETEQQALYYLRKVIDPKIGLNIFNLGLGFQWMKKKKAIKVKMTLTTQFCPLDASIVGSVEETLKDYFQRYDAEVELVYEPRWNADMISEEGKVFLG